MPPDGDRLLSLADEDIRFRTVSTSGNPA